MKGVFVHKHGSFLGAILQPKFHLRAALQHASAWWLRTPTFWALTREVKRRQKPIELDIFILQRVELCWKTRERKEEKNSYIIYIWKLLYLSGMITNIPQACSNVLSSSYWDVITSEESPKSDTNSVDKKFNEIANDIIFLNCSVKPSFLVLNYTFLCLYCLERSNKNLK